MVLGQAQTVTMNGLDWRIDSASVYTGIYCQCVVETRMLAKPAQKDKIGDEPEGKTGKRARKVPK